jgi:hypothetical protein
MIIAIMITYAAIAPENAMVMIWSVHSESQLLIKSTTIIAKSTTIIAMSTITNVLAIPPQGIKARAL